MFQLQGVPPSDNLVEQSTLLISSLNNPTSAVQRGGGLIDAGDDRINDASWQNGVLYVAADDQCTYPNDQYLETCARVMEISTTGAQPTLIGENDIGFPNADAYYAALRPDQSGNLIIVFGYSDQHNYPSIGATAALGPIVGEQGGTFAPSIKLAGGTAPTQPGWGDYQGAAIDPANPSVIWTVGQVADDLGSGNPYRWATHIDAVSLANTLSNSFAHQVDPGYVYRGRTSQRETVTIRPSGGGGHIASAYVTLRAQCRSGGSDITTFPLLSEGRQTISSTGRFSIRQRFGADRYATSYTITLAGVFTAPGQLRGTASATEHNRRHGLCRSARVAFKGHD